MFCIDNSHKEMSQYDKMVEIRFTEGGNGTFGWFR